jgi:hypothetical protein
MSNTNYKEDYRADKHYEQLRQQNNSRVQGLMLGILFVLGLGSIAVALFVFKRSEMPIAPVVAPSSQPASPSGIETRETIIREKSTEVVPVPIYPESSPDINIMVPSAQPSESLTQPSSESFSPLPSPSVTEPASVDPKP